MDDAMNSGTGTGQVHGHVGYGTTGTGGAQPTGTGDAGGTTGGGTVEQAKQRAGEIADQAKDRAGEIADQAKGRAQDLAGQVGGRLEGARGRAEEMVSQARDRAGNLLNQAGSRIESSGAMAKAQENPLAAVGIAFAIGFLLAGSSDSGGRFGKAKHQIRGAIVGGISAAIAQEARNILGGDTADQLLGNLFGSNFGGRA